MEPRTIVSTGASSGIGEAAARALAQTGDTIVVVGRSVQRTRAVADAMVELPAGGPVHSGRREGWNSRSRQTGMLRGHRIAQH